MASWDTGGNVTAPNEFLGTNNPQALVLKTDGVEHMRIAPGGKVGLGSSNPSARLSVVESGGSEITGGARSSTLLASSAQLGVAQGSEVALASMGLKAEGNNVMFGIRAIRASTGDGWLTTSIGLGMDVDDTVRAGASLFINPYGVGIGASPQSSIFEVVKPAPGQLGPSLTLTNTGGGVNATAAVDFNTFAPSYSGGYNPSARIQAVDAGNFANDIIFLSNNAGNPSNGLAERLRIGATGNVRIAGLVESTAGGFKFPDGTSQNTAQLVGPRGPAGPAGPQGQQGVPGQTLPPQVAVTTNTAGGGFIALFGPGGGQTCQLSGIVGAPNNGVIAVTDAAGSAAGYARARMYVDPSGLGVVEAQIKSFRMPNPTQADMDIVYACIEGPEAAAYARGTARLASGVCTIALPAHFASVVNTDGVTVQLTPLSSDSLGLAVTQKSAVEIVVRELHHGVGNYEFDWEIKGIRKGHEDYQVIRPRNELALWK
jgi:hypothetical protein